MDHSEVKHLPKVDHTPAELDEASKILLKAAALIDKRGWCVGVLEDAGRLCARGALHMAATGNYFPFDAKECPAGSEAERRLMQSVGADTPGEIGSWNNQQGRTKDEVVAKLRAVALGIV